MSEVVMSKMRVRRRDKRAWSGVVTVFFAVFLFVFLRGATSGSDSEVGAASLANFDPGYIISDYQMGRYDAMSEAEIQAFLTSKNSCSYTNYNDYVWLSNNSIATWHYKDGHFVCLSEELFGDGEVIGSGETAAHSIWQAAQDYRINPQALIVLLQKETSLITDPIPNNYDYRKAAGYGCPDTAACSSQYYGFKNQVRHAAALFHEVLAGGWTNYPLGDNYVQYNPSAACGGSVVNIRSLATSALYRYTPYQPNASAIAAGYGTGDAWGAYGNRNFYLYYEDWFGGAKEERIKVPEIDELYQENGGEKGVLGKKKTEVLTNELSGIYWVEYENGYILGKRETGYYISMGKIRDVWVSQGWEFGPLGFPKSNILSNSASGIEWQEFENGFIVGNKDHGYYVSMGPIRDVWVSQGWEFGVLGFPKSNIEVDINGVEFQEYYGGIIRYIPTRGAWVE